LFIVYTYSIINITSVICITHILTCWLNIGSIIDVPRVKN